MAGAGGRIRREDIQAVQERADLAQVVSQHLQLKKAGRDSLVGLCPFHSEKTPSFSVSPSKQVYHCFGCGEGGDVFRFLEKVEGLPFVEAVERLAGATGVTLRYEGETQADRQRAGRRQVTHRALGEAEGLYHRTLLDRREAAEAREYLRTRGFRMESIERFNVGYAPAYQDFMLKRLSRGFSPELLVEAGLATKDSAGELRDRFRGRIMFPVHDLSGNCVGFGGRHLARAGQPAPEGVAKYVNSPDGPVYHKGRLLYNLNRAKGEITRTGRAFLVEGYTDVIALDQAGIRGAVATCGTALGEDHLRLIARFTERVVLAFDSDEAGARAAERAYQFHERYPVDVSVVVLPSGQDPADFALASGGDAFLELADRAVPLVEYMLDRTLAGRDLSGVEDRARAIRAGLALVAGLEDPVRRQEYARLLADRVGETEVAVMLQLEQTVSSGGLGSGEAPGPTVRGRSGPEEEVESEVLKLLIQAPQMCSGWRDQLQPEHFVKPTRRKIFELLSEAWARGEQAGSMAALSTAAYERAGGEELGRQVTGLALQPIRSLGEPTLRYAESYFLKLEENLLKRRAEAIRKRLQVMNPQKTSEQYDVLYREFVALEGARRRAREAAEAVGGAP